MHKKGVAARKEEKAWVKHVKELTRQNITIPVDMLHSIEDPEAIWKANDPTWQIEEAKKEAKKQRQRGDTEADEADTNDEGEDDEAEAEAEITFLIDAIGDAELRRSFLEGPGYDPIRRQRDYVAFGMEEDYIDEGHVAVDRDDNHVLEQLGYYSKQVLQMELIGLIMR